MTVTVSEDPIIINSTVDLVCTATGDSPITYEWVLVGEEDTVLNTDTTTGDFSFTIGSADQYGTYRCTATNVYGSDSDTVEVLQAGR